MRKIKLFFLFVLFVSISGYSFGQEDPASWKYEIKKKSATEYQLIFHLDLKPEWHIWSLHPGGDGDLIAPSFTLDKDPNVKLLGKVVEKGKATNTKMEGITGKVNYLSGKIDYTQNVTVTGNSTMIKGKHTYQVCNDRMCLPPKDKEFTFDIKASATTGTK